MKGITISLYGINNLGKTTQAKLLVENLKNLGYRAVYQKYAVYDIEPSGSLINSYLREGNPDGLSPDAMQVLQVLNRTQFEPELKKMLKEGNVVVMEDYTGTGIAWGTANGVKKEFLEKANSHLLKEDIAFFFYGNRFISAKEKNHMHEQNDELTQKAFEVHSQLAKENDWIPINANESIEQIATTLLRNVLGYIKTHEKELMDI